MWGHRLGRDPPPTPLSYALRSSFSEQPPRAGQLASWAAVGQAGVSSLCPAHLRPYYPGPNPTGVKKAGAVETCVSVAAAADGGGLPGPGTTGALLSSWGPRAGRAPGLCIPPAGPTAPRHLLLGGVGALLGSQGSIGTLTAAGPSVGGPPLGARQRQPHRICTTEDAAGVRREAAASAKPPRGPRCATNCSQGCLVLC